MALHIHTLRRPMTGCTWELSRAIEEEFGGRLLRYYIGAVEPGEARIDAIIDDETLDQPMISPIAAGDQNAVILSIPTGIGCSIGGYAGDGAPAVALMAAAAGSVITHPNAVNASNFVSIPHNVLYTEGYALDQFARGLVNLHHPASNRVGLIVEHSQSQHIDHVFNIANAVRAVHGVDLEDIVITRKPIGGRCVRTEQGAYTGTVADLDELCRAADILVARGVNAIAVTSNVQGLDADNYAAHYQGEHANPVGGVEAVISHFLSRRYGIPAAHGPMMNFRGFSPADPVVDARGAGEYASSSGIACVLIGLARAAQTDPRRSFGTRRVLSADSVLAVVAPATALGSVPVICAEHRGIPIIAVRDNATLLDVTAHKLGLQRCIEVGSYLEAAGVIVALRAGVALSSLKRPLITLRPPAEVRAAR